MRVLIFTGEQQTYDHLTDTIRLIISNPQMHQANDYDRFRRELTHGRWDLVVVAAPGAQGMETCIGARKIRPRIPLFWFSDDPLFAAQSYRLNCTYFGVMPVSGRMMENAFGRIGEHTAIHAAMG